MFFIEFVGVL